MLFHYYSGRISTATRDIHGFLFHTGIKQKRYHCTNPSCTVRREDFVFCSENMASLQWENVINSNSLKNKQCDLAPASRILPGLTHFWSEPTIGCRHGRKRAVQAELVWGLAEESVPGLYWCGGIIGIIVST